MGTGFGSKRKGCWQMAHDATVQERVQELAWALVDDQINDDEMQLLESLLLSDDAARDTYVNCIQLHTDLLAHYADQTKRPLPGGTSSVLGFLSESIPPFDVQPSSQ
jgi:hypothetical protein